MTKSLPHQQELLALRHSIDKLDAALVELLGKRFSCTRQIGVLKAKAKLPVQDLEREKQQKITLEKEAIAHGVDVLFLQELFDFLRQKVREENQQIAQDIEKNAQEPLKSL